MASCIHSEVVFLTKVLKTLQLSGMCMDAMATQTILLIRHQQYTMFPQCTSQYASHIVAMVILVFIGCSVPRLLSIQYFSLSFTEVEFQWAQWSLGHTTNTQPEHNTSSVQKGQIGTRYNLPAVTVTFQMVTQRYMVYKVTSLFNHYTTGNWSRILAKKQQTLSPYILLIDTPLNSSDR